MSSLNLNINISLCDCGIACDVQFPSNVAEKAENKPHKNILSTTKSTQKAYYCNYTVRHFFFTAPVIHNIIVLFTSTGLLNFYELFDEKKKKRFAFFRHKQWLKMVSFTNIVFLVLLGSVMSDWPNPKFEVTYGLTLWFKKNILLQPSFLIKKTLSVHD